MKSELILHQGGCHCGRIKWRVKASRSVVAWNCNCTNCSMRGNVHFIVPSSNFELLDDSKEFITTYTFGTHTAKHTFCKVCGITSFYTPRSNPDGVAVTVKCVKSGTKAMMVKTGKCRTSRLVLPRVQKSDMIRSTQHCNMAKKKRI